MCQDVGFRIHFSSSINAISKLFLLVETEQADEDQNEADPTHKLKEEDEFENPTELDDNGDELGIIFSNICRYIVSFPL